MNAVTQEPRSIASRLIDAKTVLRLGSGIGALALVSLAQPAFAADECGTAPTGGTVTCTAAPSAGVLGNVYPTVNYTAGTTGPLTVVLNADTVVNAPATVGVNVSTGAQNQTITAAAASSVSAGGVGNDGYRLNTTSGNITASTGVISVSGDNTWGINANTDTGIINLTATNTTTSGTTGRGISVSSDTGPVTVNTGAVTTSGDAARGVVVNSNSGNVIINGGTVTTTGPNAARGIDATTGGAGTLTITGGTTTTAGIGANGVSGTTNTGLLTINTGTVSTTGANAIGASGTSTSGNVIVNGAGKTVGTTGANAFGLFAATGGAGTANVTGGTVTTTGAGAIAIRATTDTGALTVTGGTTSTTAAATNAIQANTGTGLLTVNTGTATTTAADSIGVSATSTTGNIIVNGGTVSTQGINALGIFVATGGAGTTAVTGGAVTTVGDNAIGVRSTTGTGAANIAATSVTTSGASAHGVFAQGTGAVTAGATTINTTGANAFGIIVQGGTATTANYGNIATTGAGSYGVFAPGLGAASLTTVTGSTAGLLSTTGAGAVGIAASSAGGVTVNVGRVSATGLGSLGIDANSTGGAVNVTSTGVVANATAVTATNTGGAASVVLSGTNNSVTGTGALINGSTSASLNLNGGTLNGAVDGANLTSVTGSTVTNTGAVTGTNSAITVNGGAATVNNNAGGAITGRIILTGNADTVTNAGTFNASSTTLMGGGADVFNNSGTFNAATSGAIAVDFGAGTDVFNNSGTLRVLPSAVIAGSSTLANLETFNNNGGLIDLRNTVGHTGDNLNLGAANYVGSGNAGLAVDVNFNTGPTTSDLLTTTGSATGTTAVTINRLGSPAILSTAAGTTFVDAGAGSTAGAFVIAPASQFDGVIQYGVVFDPTTNNYALVSAPSAAAYRTSLFGDGVRNLWLQSGDAWSGHMRELRDNVAANGPGGSGGRFWFQGFGNVEKRSSGRTVTFNGITSNLDLGYDQDYYGFQMGVDLGTPVGDEGGFNFGVTGGYQSSNMSFASNTVADKIKFNVVNGGLYAAFNSGIFFVNALGKYDYYWGETSSPAGLFGFDTSGGVWGAKAEAGLRFGSAFFVEPSVSVSWTNSDFDSFTVPSGSFAINDEDGLRGKAGARFGTVFDSGSAKVTVYGGANYVREFRGRSNVVFTSGGQVVAFSSPRNADYVEGTLGVNIGSDAGKISGFFEGRYADGRDYDGYGARGGVRVRF